MDGPQVAFAPGGLAPSQSGIADPKRIGGSLDWGLLGKGPQRKNCGRTQRVVAGDAPTVIDTIGLDPLATVCTVTLHVDVASDIPAAEQTWAMLPPLVAYIQWGVDGGTNSAEVDVIRGQALQLPASQLIVRVGLDPLPAVLAGLPRARAAMVSGSVGYMPSAVGPARRTRYGFLLANGGAGDSVTVDVPRFARSVQLIAQGGTPIRIRQLGPSGIILGELNTLDPNARMPLCSLATQVTAQNLGAAPTMCPLSFELAL